MIIPILESISDSRLPHLWNLSNIPLYIWNLALKSMQSDFYRWLMSKDSRYIGKFKFFSKNVLQLPTVVMEEKWLLREVELSGYGSIRAAFPYVPAESDQKATEKQPAHLFWATTEAVWPRVSLYSLSITSKTIEKQSKSNLWRIS